MVKILGDWGFDECANGLGTYGYSQTCVQRRRKVAINLENPPQLHRFIFFLEVKVTKRYTIPLIPKFLIKKEMFCTRIPTKFTVSTHKIQKIPVYFNLFSDKKYTIPHRISVNQRRKVTFVGRYNVNQRKIHVIPINHKVKPIKLFLKMLISVLVKNKSKTDKES